jgi:hypothetical protein
MTFQTIDGWGQKAGPEMFIDRLTIRATIAAVVAVASVNCVAIHGQVDFVAAVTSARPFAYDRLDSTEGRSLAGTTTYRPVGSVISASPGAPIAVPGNDFAKLDGRTGYFLATQAGGNPSAAPGMGPFATTAEVTASDSNGPMKLKREEQIALMFLMAIENIERDCQSHAQHACTLDEMLAGPVATDHWHIFRLKFNPNKTDPNYTYTLRPSGMEYEAHANARKRGLLGFCLISKGFSMPTLSYSATGTATLADKEVLNRGVSGDSFSTK